MNSSVSISATVAGLRFVVSMISRLSSVSCGHRDRHPVLPRSPSQWKINRHCRLTRIEWNPARLARNFSKWLLGRTRKSERAVLLIIPGCFAAPDDRERARSSPLSPLRFRVSERSRIDDATTERAAVEEQKSDVPTARPTARRKAAGITCGMCRALLPLPRSSSFQTRA